MTLATLATEVLLTLSLLTNPQIHIPETPTIPYSEPTKQPQHRKPEAIYSEQIYNFSQKKKNSKNSMHTPNELNMFVLK